MAVGLVRATVMAIKEEAIVGDFTPPTVGADFVPLRPGSTLSFEAEKLDSDELLNDIGAAKSFIGKESTKGEYSAYLRHSGVEGQEPQIGVLYESIMGAKVVNATEYPTLASSTTLLLKVTDGTDFYVGQTLLIKDSSNGFSIRNIAEIDGNDLILNFALDAAPAASVNLGRAINYLPAAQGHPSFSILKFIGNGHAIEATAGNTATELTITADANGFGESSFSFEGTKYFFDPILVDATSKFLDFTDDSGTHSVSLVEKIYRTPVEFADALQSAMTAVSPEPLTVVYSSVDGKFTIASGTSPLSLLWDSGTNAGNSVGGIMGFNTGSDDTGALTYTSDDALVFDNGTTPIYDAGDAIIIKGAQLFVGSQADNLCVCAQSVSLKVSKTVEDVDCICEETGVLEKIATARTVEMEVTSVLNKYDASILSALLKNGGLSAMLNAGPKTGGNWVAGSCFNAYLENCTVSAYSTTGDSFVQATFTLKGFVTTSGKDLFLGFV
jgi:hypothetical protein